MLRTNAVTARIWRAVNVPTGERGGTYSDTGQTVRLGIQPMSVYSARAITDMGFDVTTADTVGFVVNGSVRAKDRLVVDTDAYYEVEGIVRPDIRRAMLHLLRVEGTPE